MDNKFVSLHEFSRIRSDTLFGKKIIFTTGVYDIPHHIGHPRYLNVARKLGDILVVGVHSDELVRLRKGNDRPIDSVYVRMEYLAFWPFVDFVLILENQEKVYDTIRKLRPDILVTSKSTEDIDNCPETMVNMFGNLMRVVILEEQSSMHSTDFLKNHKNLIVK